MTRGKGWSREKGGEKHEALYAEGKKKKIKKNKKTSNMFLEKSVPDQNCETLSSCLSSKYAIVQIKTIT